MAKETNKTQVVSACEQYVVDELKQAKKELAELKEVNKAREEQLNDLLRLIRVIDKNTDIDSEHSDLFHNIHIRGQFVENVWKDINKNDEDVKEFYYAIREIHCVATQKGE